MRLDRNLHDGAQQRLVTLSLSLRLAEARAGHDSEAAHILREASAELAHALEELRDLARGIHPAVLSDHGLTVAVDALASRVPIPVEIEAAIDGRLPEHVEVAAYYVISEALTNVQKYAGASQVTIRIAEEDGHVLVEVRDDGGGGADPGAGSGLRGLADRVEALGGRLEVVSAPGSGTPCARRDSSRLTLPVSSAHGRRARGRSRSRQPSGCLSSVRCEQGQPEAHPGV